MTLYLLDKVVDTPSITSVYWVFSKWSPPTHIIILLITIVVKSCLAASYLLVCTFLCVVVSGTARDPSLPMRLDPPPASSPRGARLQRVSAERDRMRTERDAARAELEAGNGTGGSQRFGSIPPGSASSEWIQAKRIPGLRGSPFHAQASVPTNKRRSIHLSNTERWSREIMACNRRPTARGGRSSLRRRLETASADRADRTAVCGVVFFCGMPSRFGLHDKGNMFGSGTAGCEEFFTLMAGRLFLLGEGHSSSWVACEGFVGVCIK